MTDVMIEARDLTKRYGAIRALEKVSFQVRKGEVLGFLGPNGAGKTTTMKILTCFIAPTEGTAKVNGCDVFDDPIGVRKSIGYLPESTPLYTDMLVLEYLEFVARMRGIKREDQRKKIKAAVEQTGLADRVGQEIRTLSKGYKQRVGIAQALVHEPKILILDEPMSGLDPNQAVEIRDLIKQIGKERTVILSTHNLAEVQVSCDRVLIVARGKIVADDTADALVARSGKSSFRVTVAAPESGSKDDKAGKVRDAFGGIKGVDRVRAVDTQGDEYSYEIIPAGTEDLRAEIFRAAVAANLTLLGLTREGQNLEEIFRGLTTGPDKDGGKSSDKSEAAARKARVVAKSERTKDEESKSDEASSETEETEEKKPSEESDAKSEEEGGA